MVIIQQVILTITKCEYTLQVKDLCKNKVLNVLKKYKNTLR